jgi:hypothetical protein
MNSFKYQRLSVFILPTKRPFTAFYSSPFANPLRRLSHQIANHFFLFLSRDRVEQGINRASTGYQQGINRVLCKGEHGHI